MRWPIKDKDVLLQVKERLKSVESTLQGIAAMEQLRVSHVIYGILRQQQFTLDRIQNSEISTDNILNMAVINQSSPQSLPSVVQAQLSEIKPMSKR